MSRLSNNWLNGPNGNIARSKIFCQLYSLGCVRRGSGGCGDVGGGGDVPFDQGHSRIALKTRSLTLDDCPYAASQSIYNIHITTLIFLTPINSVSPRGEGKIPFLESLFEERSRCVRRRTTVFNGNRTPNDKYPVVHRS